MIKPNGVKHNLESPMWSGHLSAGTKKNNRGEHLPREGVWNKHTHTHTDCVLTKCATHTEKLWLVDDGRRVFPVEIRFWFCPCTVVMRFSSVMYIFFIKSAFLTRDECVGRFGRFYKSFRTSAFIGIKFIFSRSVNTVEIDTKKSFTCKN